MLQECIALCPRIFHINTFWRKHAVSTNTYLMTSTTYTSKSILHSRQKPLHALNIHQHGNKRAWIIKKHFSNLYVRIILFCRGQKRKLLFSHCFSDSFPFSRRDIWQKARLEHVFRQNTQPPFSLYVNAFATRETRRMYSCCGITFFILLNKN